MRLLSGAVPGGGGAPQDPVAAMLAAAQGGGGGGGGGGGPPPGQQVVRLTPEEGEAVQRLIELGFDRSMAVQAYTFTSSSIREVRHLASFIYFHVRKGLRCTDARHRRRCWLSATSAPGMSQMDPRRRRGQEAKVPANAIRGTRYEDQFFKTKMCMFWEKGACTRGFDCKYAHGDKELNQMPNLTKTSLCRDLLTTGSCTRRFGLVQNGIRASSSELRATNEFYKTSMCSFFRVGQCKLGDACRHAHDPAELVDMPKKETWGGGRQEAFTTDDAEMSQTVSSGRVGRRGGRKARDKLNKPVQKDLEEDDELDTGSVFERVTTSPATFMWTPQSPNSHGTSTPESISTATGSTVADEEGSPTRWGKSRAGGIVSENARRGDC
eukprot:g6303.t1